jgi:hypothetical protein
MLLLTIGPNMRNAMLGGALALTTALLSMTVPAAAHPPAIVNSQAEKLMAEEVADFRKRLAKAIADRNAALLRKMYADSFRHTDASATIAGKDARIAAALAGTAMIETAAADDLVISVPNGWAAIATGRSRIKPRSGGSAANVRWTVVYVRVGEDWQVAASQETSVSR